MKKLLVILFFATLAAYAQPGKNAPLEKEINGRIRLQEKANQSLSVLPRMLLTAFCQGQIKAYYPNKPGVEMSFDNFVAYFSIPYKPVPDTTGHTCMCDMCKSLNAEFVSAFSEYMDYTEIERFNAAESRYSYETEYLRIMLPLQYTWQNKEYQGPVFRYADVVKLFPSPVFFNRQNDAAYFTLKHIFSNRLFAPEIKPDKDMYGRPQWNEPNPEMEQQVWEN